MSAVVTTISPWQRVKEPVAIPGHLSTRALMGLSDEEFAVLIRDHLTVRIPPSEVKVRRVSDLSMDDLEVLLADHRLRLETHAKREWSRLWRALTISDPLAARTQDLLDGWMKQARAAMGDPQTSDKDRRRIHTKFLPACEKAWNRLDKADDEPLAWAGAAGLRHSPQSQEVIAALVAAIDEHRDARQDTATMADEQLWLILDQLNLDPRTSSSQ